MRKVHKKKGGKAYWLCEEAKHTHISTSLTPLSTLKGQLRNEKRDPKREGEREKWS